MQMIGHQDVGVDGNLELPRSLFKPSEKNGVIFCVTEDGLPVIAALDDVMRLVGNDKSR